jgi:hypothetical protein
MSKKQEKKVVYTAVELMKEFDKEKIEKWIKENPEEYKKAINR